MTLPLNHSYNCALGRLNNLITVHESCLQPTYYPNDNDLISVYVWYTIFPILPNTTEVANLMTRLIFVPETLGIWPRSAWELWYEIDRAKYQVSRHTSQVKKLNQFIEDLALNLKLSYSCDIRGLNLPKLMVCKTSLLIEDLSIKSIIQDVKLLSTSSRICLELA
ncbi:hypothetical protein VNO77_14588 [Canavalia gladiata]|uniref:Uncharacterized protein n=1 Tax=Canavalia gladiata TaxID=3824 RepID=A0AAN9M3L0_CANGL